MGLVNVLVYSRHAPRIHTAPQGLGRERRPGFLQPTLSHKASGHDFFCCVGPIGGRQAAHNRDWNISGLGCKYDTYVGLHPSLAVRSGLENRGWEGGGHGDGPRVWPSLLLNLLLFISPYISPEPNSNIQTQWLPLLKIKEYWRVGGTETAHNWPKHERWSRFNSAI